MTVCNHRRTHEPQLSDRLMADHRRLRCPSGHSHVPRWDDDNKVWFGLVCLGVFIAFAVAADGTP
jgi:hypothetical protein